MAAERADTRSAELIPSACGQFLGLARSMGQRLRGNFGLDLRGLKRLARLWCVRLRQMTDERAEARASRLPHSCGRASLGKPP